MKAKIVSSKIDILEIGGRRSVNELIVRILSRRNRLYYAVFIISRFWFVAKMLIGWNSNTGQVLD